MWVIIWVEVAFKIESDPLRFSERIEKIYFDFMIWDDDNLIIWSKILNIETLTIFEVVDQ